MAIKSLPDQEVLRKILRYEPETGKLYWRERDTSLFNATQTRSASHAASQWNSRWAGKEAFTSICSKGYHAGNIFDSSFRAHRVIWKMVNNEDSQPIDHINHDRSDNRIENLRAVPHAVNCRNRKLRNDNKSGINGVYWNKREKKWCAAIHKSGRCIHLGYFTSKDEAITARVFAGVEYGFHPNHGKLSSPQVVKLEASDDEKLAAIFGGM